MRSGKSITAQQSEAFLDAIFQEGVLNVDSLSLEKKHALTNLAHALQQNHHDSWFKDFVDAPFSVKANHFLQSATANRNTNAKRALKDARVAEDLYLQAGNIAGAARSQIEIIYAYRRLSRSSECLQEIDRLKERVGQQSYTSFQFLGDYESTNCQTMLGNFDLGRQFAEQAYREADGANYSSLKLRALGLFSAMASVEGRYQAAFNLDAAELAIYWDGYYEGKRGFQFYSDAALIAEQAGYWQLAAVLQREAIDSLAGTDLFDFQATAHYHLATSLLRAGNLSQAQQEFREAYNLFGKMQDPSFLLANSEVELAEIEIEQGSVISAQAHLKKAASVIDHVDNLLVKLSYYNTQANLERLRKQPTQEWRYLKKTIAIARHGFLNLGSMDNRWEWYREVDRSFHRLIELELDAKHDPMQALADWEAYRAAEIAPTRLAAGDRLNRARLASHLKGMHSSTLVSFIVFPEKVVIWVADNRDVRVFSTAVDSETLSHEAGMFLRLCSDQTSSLEKVKQVGSRLYRRLLQPIQKELMPDRSLTIEADGFLSRIPWPALVGENGEYLDEQYMTASTPGLFFSDTGHGRRKAVAGRLVVYPGAAEYEGKVYPPLPHAREEAAYVASLQPDSTYLREEQATGDELLKKLPRASSFHFAGHGVSREHGGELLLSGKEVLSASAVRRLNLSGMGLVVLSACSTAEADLDVARSPNGLVEAFLSAGARQIVATRWDADSKASLEFSMNFYTTLVASADVATAVRTARRAIRSDPNMQHPSYWGVFSLFASAQ